MIVTTLFFFVYTIAIIPFAYVKMYFHKLVMIFVYSKSYRTTRADKFIQSAVFLVIGPVVLTLNSIVDLYWFIKHLLSMDIEKTKHKSRD